MQGSNGDTDIGNRPANVVGGGEEGEGETYGESNMETYITTRKIDNQWEFAVWFRELKLGLCNNLEGGMARELGRKLKREGTYVYQ